MDSSRTLTVREQILAANAAAAAELRRRFHDAGTLVVNLISSPGSGKTSLLEASLPRLAGWSVAVLEGDIATDRDAARIRRLGIPAHQILTGGSCHLDARQVVRELDQAAFPRLDFLFIENVGNLICPTSYDLGEDFKVALLSVAEGDDKPFKYPGIFSRAAVTVISKLDLLPHVDFDLEAVRRQILTLNGSAVVLETSARSGAGIEQWCRLLQDRLARKRSSMDAGEAQ